MAWKGHDFSRAKTTAKRPVASAPEGRFPSRFAHVSPCCAKPCTRNLTFRVELRDVAELLLARGDQFFDRHSLQLGQVPCERRAQNAGADFMIGVRAPRR